MPEAWIRTRDLPPFEATTFWKLSPMVAPSTMRRIAFPAMELIPLPRLFAKVLSRTVIVTAPEVLFALMASELFSSLLSLMTTTALPPTAGCTTIPPPVVGAIPLLVITLLFTSRTVLAAFGANRTPMADPALKFMIFTLVRVNELPLMKLMPIKPLPIPLIDRFRRFTVIFAPLMLKPFVPAARTEPKVPPQSIVIDFVIVTAPKPPGSRQSISPLGAVFEIAPANVLQGAVRLQGLASSPTPETHVRVAWARAGTACSARTSN